MKLVIVIVFSVFTSLFLTSSAQTCSSYSFTNNEKFSTCRDLPQLSAYLHWTYDSSTQKLDIAYRHTGVTSTSTWVAWALNPGGSLSNAMIGAQALVAIPAANGSVKAYTSPIADTSTQLQEGSLSFGVSGLNATYSNNEVIIFASLNLTGLGTSVIHTWQDGGVSGSTPQSHSMNSANLEARETLNLVSGESQAGSSGSSLRRRRNVSSDLQTFFFSFFYKFGE